MNESHLVKEVFDERNRERGRWTGRGRCAFVLLLYCMCWKYFVLCRDTKRCEFWYSYYHNYHYDDYHYYYYYYFDRRRSEHTTCVPHEISELARLMRAWCLLLSSARLYIQLFFFFGFEKEPRNVIIIENPRVSLYTQVTRGACKRATGTRRRPDEHAWRVVDKNVHTIRVPKSTLLKEDISRGPVGRASF